MISDNVAGEMSRDVLITGHEDGTVKFWACSGVALTPMATLTTKQFFQGNDLDEPCGKFQSREDMDVSLQSTARTS